MLILHWEKNIGIFPVIYRNSIYSGGEKNTCYAILCVKYVREVRYFTSKVAIFSLSALVVRKVTGGKIIE